MASLVDSLASYIYTTLAFLGHDPSEAQPVQRLQIIALAWCREMLEQYGGQDDV